MTILPVLVQIRVDGVPVLDYAHVRRQSDRMYVSAFFRSQNLPNQLIMESDRSDRRSKIALRSANARSKTEEFENGPNSHVSIFLFFSCSKLSNSNRKVSQNSPKSVH